MRFGKSKVVTKQGIRGYPSKTQGLQDSEVTKDMMIGTISEGDDPESVIAAAPDDEKRGNRQASYHDQHHKTGVQVQNRKTMQDGRLSGTAKRNSWQRNGAGMTRLHGNGSRIRPTSFGSL